MKFPKNISFTYNSVHMLLLCTICSTNIFGMRMSEAGKKYAQRNSIQQMQQQQQRLQEQQQQQLQEQQYQQKMHEREQKLQTAVVPYWSYKQKSPTKPVIFYDPKPHRMSLYFVENNQLSNSSIAPINVSSYNFSPQKKYLIFQMTSGSMQSDTSWTESLKIKALEKITGHKIGEKIDNAIVTKIVDIQAQKEIASFDGQLITYEFSPDETTLFIARKNLNKKLSNEGAHPLGSIGLRPYNDTMQYELFDITSQSMLKTFENVQAIDYTTDNNLIVQYDDETVKEFTLQKSSSLFSRFSSTGINEKIGDVQNISKKITYYDTTKELSITLANRKKIKETDVTAYSLSPLKNYLVLFKGQTSYAVNMKTGKSELIAADTITYEFSPDQKETHLVVLGAPREYFTGETTIYSLVDSVSNSTSLATFTIDNTFYFKSSNKLIVVDKNGASTSYDAQTGISSEKEQHQKRKQLMKEIRTKKQMAEKPLTTTQPQENSIYNYLKSFFEQNNKKETQPENPMEFYDEPEEDLEFGDIEIKPENDSYDVSEKEPMYPR